MANYSALKAAIQAVIKTNGAHEITGANMQTTLLSIIDSLGNGYQFMGVATPSTTPPSSPDYNIAYIAGSGSYTNFGTSVVIPPTNIAIFKYNGSWTCEQVTVENGGVFDITAYNNNTTYADLAAALGTGGANVPEGVRKGGMSVKFVQSSDNKYVQYFCNAQEFTTDISVWEKVNLEKEVKRLDKEIYSYGERGSLGAYIDNSNHWSVAYNPISNYIKVKKGDRIQARRNDGIHICFIESVDTSQTPVFAFGGINTGQTLEVAFVPKDCYLVWISSYNGNAQVYTVLSINGVSFLDESYLGESKISILNNDVDRLDNDLYQHPDYGLINAYIASNNTWSTSYNPTSGYVKVYRGDSIHVVKGISDFQIAFLNTVDITQSVSFAFGGIVTSSSYDIVAPTDCYLYWIVGMNGNINAKPSVLNINGISYLNTFKNQTNIDKNRSDIELLNKNIYTHSDYGKISAYVANDITWSTNYNPTSRYIKVFKGDRVQITKSSSNYVCLLRSVDTSVTPVIAQGGGILTDTSIDITINQDCYLVWLSFLNSNNADPSTLTINGQSYLYDYKKSTKFDGIEQKEFEIETSLLEQKSQIDSVSESKAINIVLTENNTTQGKYWNVDGNGDALMVDGNAYALNYLVLVQPGQIYRIYNAKVSTGVAILGGYDENDHGYNNGVARINVEADNIKDGYIELTIPLRCRKIGIFATPYGSLTSDPILATVNNDFDFTPKAIEKIQNIINISDVSSSAYYYQKGAAPKSLTRIPCVLVAGQSNGDGRVPFSDLPSEMASASPYTHCKMAVYGWGDNFREVDINHYFSTVWGYDLPVYYYFSSVNQQDLYVLKYAVGGCSIDPYGGGVGHWSADYEKVIAENDDPLLLQFNNMITGFIARNPNLFDVKAILWHQGEGDYSASVSGRYYQNFKNMVAYLRGVVGNVNLPIIYGTISHDSAGYSAEVEQAQLQFAQEDENAYVIDMSGAPLLDESPNPPLHFDADSCVYLGQMVFNKLIDIGIINATKLTPVRPW